MYQCYTDVLVDGLAMDMVHTFHLCMWPTTWSMGCGFAMTTSSVVWVQQKWVCYELACSTQHMAAEDRDQYLKGEGIGVGVCHARIATKGGIFTSLQALVNWETPIHPLVPFLCATEPWYPPNFHISRQCIIIRQHQSILQKQMEDSWTYGWMLCCWSHCHFVFINIVSEEDNSYYVTICHYFP